MAIVANSDPVWAALSASCFKRKVIRDLLWSITSPHLIDAALFPVLPASFGVSGDAEKAAILVKWLIALESDPVHLVTFLRGKTTSRAKALALGVYFASLLEYWLRFSPLLDTTKFELSKQIVSATNQTLGQLKFLFRLRQNEAQFDDYHVESSVKFFILHPLDEKFSSEDCIKDSDGTVYPLEQFVGPHSGENLAWRVQEVARKLDMCRGDSVQGWLREHYSDEVKSRIVLKGYLFYPLEHFQATADIARDHDWHLHRNASRATEPCQLRHDQKIGADHLRGWWTYDLEHDLPVKVRANLANGLGESRFFVLPKLYWLSSLVASEDPQDGVVRIAGDDEMQFEPIQAQSLEDLITNARAHFTIETSLREALPQGAVIMPLLVSEVVRCKPHDLEYSPTAVHWREISRGFLLDPKCWDPLPLCHEAVRYKRTTAGAGNHIAAREYEGRSGWVNDGVIKPTDEELERLRQSKLHHFTAVETMTASRMCHELVVLLHERPKQFTHQNLKQSIQSVITQQRSTGTNAGQFVLDCLRCLVFECHAEAASDGAIKTVPRVAHLILDAFEPIVEKDGDCSMVAFVELFVDITRDDTHWDFVNLSLRAIAIVQEKLGAVAATTKTTPMYADAARRLLAQRLHRWNAVAVEIVRVVFAHATDDAGIVELRRQILESLMGQRDWKNAEILATVCSASDLQLVVVLFSRFSVLKMTKPMKRLRKVLTRLHGDGDIATGSGLSSSERHVLHQHALGRPLDIIASRARVVGDIPPLMWCLVDTPDLVAALVEKLAVAAAESKGEMAIVGLDCEWRPAFMTTESDGDASREEDSVSVYQIAVRDHVYVVDVQALGTIAQEPLRCMWRAPRGCFLVVGFCVSEDLRRLRHSFPTLLQSHDMQSKLLVELKQIALHRQLPASTWGLSQLYEACFGEPVDKEQQCSDWGLRPLTSQQLQYAAMDAYAVRNIAQLLLADHASAGDSLIEFVQRFAVVTEADDSLAGSVLGHWITTLTPLTRSDVYSALVNKGLVSVAQSIFEVRHEQARMPQGLLVKTIAIALRKSGRTDDNHELQYVAVVLHVEASINMAALASHLHVAVDDLQLADRETLLRVFGYQRGCVGPIGLRESAAIHVVIDTAVMAEEAILPGAGQEHFVYVISPVVLNAAVTASVAMVACS